MAQVTLKGNPCRTSGTLPKIGSHSPNFILSDSNLEDKTLQSFAGRRKLLYFVPSLDTGVCLLSTKKIDKELEKHPNGVALIISCDLPFAQKRICGLEGLKNVVTLSTVRSKDFIKEMGLLIEEGPLKGLTARAIVVLNEKDEVIYEELVSEIASEPNYDRALQALKS